jgi:hypothetical protein
VGIGILEGGELGDVALQLSGSVFDEVAHARGRDARPRFLRDTIAP